MSPVFVLGAVLAVTVIAIETCPGESSRYGDHKCIHDATHRVCATLLDGSGSPLNWGAGNFWQITGQEAFQWDADIRANGGDSWCICMWATARLIESVGCDNVHLNCDATDVDYVSKSYTDGGIDLEPAKMCLAQKCGVAATASRLYEAVSVWKPVSPAHVSNGAVVALGTMAACAIVFGALLAATLPRDIVGHSSNEVSEEGFIE